MIFFVWPPEGDMNKTLNTVLWVILFLFLVPSSLAVASWNSLPGTRLFTTKLFMEQALAFLVPSAQAKGNLQIAYAERRFSEADRMLADQASVEGLPYLNSQIDVAKNQILASNDPTVRHQLAQKYITSLQNMDTELETQKQILKSTSTPTPTPRIKPTVNPRTFATPTPTPTPAPPPPPDGGSIDDTQKHIHDTIHDIETLSTPDKGNKGNNQDKQNKDNNGNDGNNDNNGNNDQGNGNKKKH